MRLARVVALSRHTLNRRACAFSLFDRRQLSSSLGACDGNHSSSLADLRSKYPKIIDVESQSLNALHTKKDRSTLVLSELLSSIDKALEKEDVESAFTAYLDVIALDSVLDIIAAEKFIQLSAKKFDLVAIDVLFQFQSITSNMLVEIGEMLIMSGKLDKFAEYFHKYCLRQSLPSSSQVTRVLRAYKLGRMRRAKILPDLTNVEVDSINNIYTTIENYHIRMFHENHIVDWFGSPSATAFEDLKKNETNIFRFCGHDEPFKNYSEKFLNLKNNNEPLLMSELLPEERFLNDYPSYSKPLGSSDQFIKVNDVTKEICTSNEKNITLYPSQLFPGQFNRECDEVNLKELQDESTKPTAIVDRLMEGMREKMPSFMIPLGSVEHDGKKFALEAVFSTKEDDEMEEDEYDEELDDDEYDEDDDSEGEDMRSNEEEGDSDSTERYSRNNNKSILARRILRDRRYYYELHKIGVHTAVPNVYSKPLPDFKLDSLGTDLSSYVSSNYRGYFLEFNDELFEGSSSTDKDTYDDDDDDDFSESDEIEGQDEDYQQSITDSIKHKNQELASLGDDEKKLFDELFQAIDEMDAEEVEENEEDDDDEFESDDGEDYLPKLEFARIQYSIHRRGPQRQELISEMSRREAERNKNNKSVESASVANVAIKESKEQEAIVEKNVNE